MVRSQRSGNLPLKQMIFCSDKKEQSPKVQLLPSRQDPDPGLVEGDPALVTLPGSVSPASSLGPPTSAPAWLRRQISAGGTFRI